MIETGIYFKRVGRGSWNGDWRKSIDYHVAVFSENGDVDDKVANCLNGSGIRYSVLQQQDRSGHSQYRKSVVDCILVSDFDNSPQLNISTRAAILKGNYPGAQLALISDREAVDDVSIYLRSGYDALCRFPVTDENFSYMIRRLLGQRLSRSFRHYNDALDNSPSPVSGVWILPVTILGAFCWGLIIYAVT
jgi:hypothetical protein